METAKAKLTVFFDPPFWAGLFERESKGQYEVCRVVFGAEPGDAGIYAYVLNRYDCLDFSPSLETERRAERTVNPKRALRMVREQVRQTGVGTKAQQALQLQREQHKTERLVSSREARQAEEERRRQLRQMKRKKKHRGR